MLKNVIPRIKDIDKLNGADTVKYLLCPRGLILCAVLDGLITSRC